MPKNPTTAELAAQLAELLVRAKAADDLALHTAKRLDRHVIGSQEIHRQLRADIATLKHRLDDLTRG